MTSASVDQRLQRHKPLWLSEIPLGTRAVRAILPPKGKKLQGQMKRGPLATVLFKVRKRTK